MKYAQIAFSALKYLMGGLVVILCFYLFFSLSSLQQKLTDETQKVEEQEGKITELKASLQNLNGAQDKLTSTEEKFLENQDKMGNCISELTKKLSLSELKIQDLSQAQKSLTAEPVLPPAAAVTTVPVPPVASPPAAPVDPNKAITDQMPNGVVIIRGDEAEGTGFFVKIGDDPYVVTNQHVISSNPNIRIYTNDGRKIIPLGIKGASDRDLALLSIPHGSYTFLNLAVDINKMAKIGDAVITPGNSQGGSVVLTTKGTLLALGSDRVEIDNPIYHGNSGGPIYHPASGTVLGIVTEAMKVDTGNELDKVSFQNRNSAITSQMRYFGLRFDTVPKWDNYDPGHFLAETTLLENFHKQSVALDSYLNSKSNKTSNSDNNTDSSAAAPYLSDEKIMKAHQNFRQLVGNDADVKSKIDALRSLCFDLDSIADTNLEKFDNLNVFYSYDRLRAQGEVNYRKALKAEIQDFSSDVERINRLPLSN